MCDPYVGSCENKNAGADATFQHHDGFCIWNTNTGTPSLRDTPCKKDVVGEYAASFRKHGLKVGLYYSILEYALIFALHVHGLILTLSQQAQRYPTL